MAIYDRKKFNVIFLSGTRQNNFQVKSLENWIPHRDHYSDFISSYLNSTGINSVSIQFADFLHYGNNLEYTLDNYITDETKYVVLSTKKLFYDLDYYYEDYEKDQLKESMDTYNKEKLKLVSDMLATIKATITKKNPLTKILLLAGNSNPENVPENLTYIDYAEKFKLACERVFYTFDVRTVAKYIEKKIDNESVNDLIDQATDKTKKLNDGDWLNVLNHEFKYDETSLLHKRHVYDSLVGIQSNVTESSKAFLSRGLLYRPNKKYITKDINILVKELVANYNERGVKYYIFDITLDLGDLTYLEDLSNALSSLPFKIEWTSEAMLENLSKNDAAKVAGLLVKSGCVGLTVMMPTLNSDTAAIFELNDPELNIEILTEMKRASENKLLFYSIFVAGLPKENPTKQNNTLLKWINDPSCPLDSLTQEIFKYRIQDVPFLNQHGYSFTTDYSYWENSVDGFELFDCVKSTSANHRSMAVYNSFAIGPLNRIVHLSMGFEHEHLDLMYQHFKERDWTKFMNLRTPIYDVRTKHLKKIMNYYLWQLLE